MIDWTVRDTHEMKKKRLLKMFHGDTRSEHNRLVTSFKKLLIVIDCTQCAVSHSAYFRKVYDTIPTQLIPVISHVSI